MRFVSACGALVFLATSSGCDSSQPEAPASDSGGVAHRSGAGVGPRPSVPAPREDGGAVRLEPSDEGRVPDGGDAGRTDVDAGADTVFEWPDAIRREPSLAALEASPCRIDYDESSDGTDERSWGFEYDAEGKLARRHTRTGDLLEVTLFDEQSRPRVRCRSGGCQRIDHLEGGALVRIDDVDSATGHATGGVATEVRYGESGKLASIDLRVADSLSYQRTEFFDGIPVSYAENEEYGGDVRAGFHPDGSLASCDASFDPGSSHVTCGEDGWELTFERNDDGATGLESSWTTTYLRDEDGRPTSSQTLVLLGEDDDLASYSAEWSWSAAGGSIELHAADGAGAFAETFRVVVAAAEIGRDHDALGNLMKVHVDEDGDGNADVTHAYRYEGSGACRMGNNPQLVGDLPDDPLDHVSLGCRFAPANMAIEQAYDVARSSRGRRWCW